MANADGPTNPFDTFDADAWGAGAGGKAGEDPFTSLAGRRDSSSPDPFAPSFSSDADDGADDGKSSDDGPSLKISDEVMAEMLADKKLKEKLVGAIATGLKDMIGQSGSFGSTNRFVMFQIDDPDAPAALPKGWGPISDRELADMVLRKKVTGVDNMNSVFVMHPFKRNDKGKLVKAGDGKTNVVDTSKTTFGVPAAIANLRRSARQAGMTEEETLAQALREIAMWTKNSFNIDVLTSCAKRAADARIAGLDIEAACTADDVDDKAGNACMFKDGACVSTALHDELNTSDLVKSLVTAKAVKADTSAAAKQLLRDRARREKMLRERVARRKSGRRRRRRFVSDE